jgi:hypothetical protein
VGREEARRIVSGKKRKRSAEGDGPEPIIKHRLVGGLGRRRPGVMLTQQRRRGRVFLVADYGRRLGELEAYLDL